MKFIGTGKTADDSIFEQGRYTVLQLGEGGDCKITDQHGEKLDLLKESRIEQKGVARVVSGVSTRYMREIGLPKEESHVEWQFTNITVGE